VGPARIRTWDHLGKLPLDWSLSILVCNDEGCIDRYDRVFLCCQARQRKAKSEKRGVRCYGLAAAASVAAWEMTMNWNDVPSTLNFILFLSRTN